VYCRLSVAAGILPAVAGGIFAAWIVSWSGWKLDDTAGWKGRRYGKSIFERTLA
jgi:hypothetical protein